MAPPRIPFRKVTTFRYGGAYWSLPLGQFERLMDTIARGEAFDLDALGARRLRHQPAVLDYPRIIKARRTGTQ
jgi:hypothetical protein